MLEIGLFYGSDTGMTEEVTNDLVEILTQQSITVQVKEADTMTVEDFIPFRYIILGLSTWYDGDLQSDWEAFFEQFKKIDFTGKKVALFGLGDQIGYADYFVDGIGILAKVVIENGGKIVGHWPRKGYHFSESKGLLNNDTFYGLPLDNDNEPEHTDKRLRTWISQVIKAFKQKSL